MQFQTRDMDRQPKVTFALIAYKQERFIADSVRAAFEQSYPNLEIILSDDASPDDTFLLIRQLAESYVGSHRVVVSQNPINLGLAGHVNKVCELATGEIIVIAAGDDISLPQRVERLVELFCNNPDAYSVYSNAAYIDDTGATLPGTLGEYRRIVPATPEAIFNGKSHAYGCSHAWRKQTYTWFGPLHPTVVYEDQALSMRSALLGQVAYIDEILVRYRMHSDNLALGKNRRSRDQFLVVQQRKVYETEQFIRDVVLFLKVQSGKPYQQNERKRLEMLLVRLNNRLDLLVSADEIVLRHGAMRLSLGFQLLLRVLREDGSLLLHVAQVVFPQLIDVKTYLQNLFRRW